MGRCMFVTIWKKVTSRGNQNKKPHRRWRKKHFQDERLNIVQQQRAQENQDMLWTQETNPKSKFHTVSLTLSFIALPTKINIYLLYTLQQITDCGKQCIRFVCLHFISSESSAKNVSIEQIYVNIFSSLRFFFHIFFLHFYIQDVYCHIHIKKNTTLHKV